MARNRDAPASSLYLNTDFHTFVPYGLSRQAREEDNPATARMKKSGACSKGEGESLGQLETGEECEIWNKVPTIHVGVA